MPAASQLLIQIALSFSILVYDFFDAISLSKSEAITFISLFSKNLLAVSFTTANASGSILSKTSDFCLIKSFSKDSICLNISSFSELEGCLKVYHLNQKVNH